MSTVAKIGSRLAVCGIACGLLLIGWATRYSIAQNPVQNSPPPVAPGPDTSPKAEEPKAAVPPTTLGTTDSERAPTLPDPGPADSLAVPSLKAEQNPGLPISATSAGAPAPVTVGPDHSPTEGDDPEKVASAFLEQNQKLAEVQLKALKEEAEKLRARLTKVDAGIKRWERLVEAFKQSQGAAGNQESAKAAKDPAAGLVAPTDEARRIEKDLGVN